MLASNPWLFIKIFFYAKDPHEAKYQFLINKKKVQA